MSTPGAHLRGVLGIDDLKQHAGLFGFIGDKLPELIESPATHAVALRLAKPGSLSDAFEVFKDNTSQSAFSLLKDTLGEDVVGITTKARLALCFALQQRTDTLASTVVGSQIGRRLKMRGLITEYDAA